MEKTLLLAKSNLRKNRGTSIGLFLMMMIASALIGVSLLVFLDLYPTGSKEAKRLNAGDGYISIRYDLNGFTDEKLEELFADDTDRYYAYRNLQLGLCSLPFGNGNVGIDFAISDKSAFSRTMDKADIVLENAAAKAPYIYLPYQFYTGGGIKLGDTFKFEFKGAEYRYTVKGFTNVAYGGCNNNGLFSAVVDDASYAQLKDRYGSRAEGIMIIYDVKDGMTSESFLIQVRNKILQVNPQTVTSGYTLSNVVASRSFMALIIAVSFLVLTSILSLAVGMMLANSISNYVKENMKTIGALKAIGYTGRNIRASLVIWFFGLACIASIIGIVLSYVMMPVFANIIVGQMGIPYSASFNLLSSLIPFIFVILFTLLVTRLCSRKISKIRPILALREGIESHNFKKNRVALDKTSLGLNMSLALKTFFGNLKQNVITFLVMGFMLFACVIALLMYENFARKPKVDILMTEFGAGVLAVDNETSDAALKYLESRDDVKNIRKIYMSDIYYKDEMALFTYIVDDCSKMNNQNVCYTGRLPIYDNEVAISGAFAKSQGYKVGDEIPLKYGENEYKYLISGFVQTVNNDGKEAILTIEAAQRLFDPAATSENYWFDLTHEDDTYSDNISYTEQIFEDCKGQFGEHVISTMNFYEIMEGGTTTFKNISVMMLTVMCTLSVIVIALILYLLIKSLIYHKRRDYGIYKALGYTSGSLMLQTALSFMPAILASAAVFSVVAYYVANPYISNFMHIFGLMKCNFTVPVVGVAIIATGLCIVAFFLALWQSRRIRKIEAYNMLVAE